MSDGSEERHGGQIVANVLKAHDVQHIFTLVSEPLGFADENVN